jgi:HAD superfamily, subfamily IIIB (Acid phosphatase)
VWRPLGTGSPPHHCLVITCKTKTCTRGEFKSKTRAHLERLGLKIVLNFGDQHSDLKGGHGNPVKVPNPTTYLP